MLVHRPHRKQRRHRHPRMIHRPVAQNQNVHILRHRRSRLMAKPHQRRLQPRRPLFHRPRRIQRPALVIRQIFERLQLVLKQKRARQMHHLRMVRRLIQKVPLPAQHHIQTHHRPLPYRINRRIRHLRKRLLEVARQQPRPHRQNRQRHIISHRVNPFLPLLQHRHQREIDLLLRPSKRRLPLRQPQHIHITTPHLRCLRCQTRPPLQPLPVRLAPRQLRLDLRIETHPALHRVHLQNLTRRQPPLPDHLRIIQRNDPHLGSQRKNPVLRQLPPARPQPIPVQPRHHP